MKINQLDLFSGIGGFHLGFHQAGYKVNSHFSEIDKHAIAVYQNQFKDATYSGSVDTIRQQQLPNIDLITFGSPCQDFSIAGQRKGMQGDRSSLILEAIRLISECRPRVFIWENVKGTFSSNGGEDFASIIQAFANIGGYRLEWQLLNTSWLLPQNRERVYVVGYLGETPRNWRGVFPLIEPSGEDFKMEKPRAAITKCLTARGQEYHSGMQLLRESNGQYRNLTPIECERLQGFPDHHTAYGDYDGEVKEMSKTQRYKQCGNAVTVNVVQAIAEKLKPLFK